MSINMNCFVNYLDNTQVQYLGNNIPNNNQLQLPTLLLSNSINATTNTTTAVSSSSSSSLASNQYNDFHLTNYNHINNLDTLNDLTRTSSPAIDVDTFILLDDIVLPNSNQQQQQHHLQVQQQPTFNINKQGNNSNNFIRFINYDLINCDQQHQYQQHQLQQQQQQLQQNTYYTNQFTPSYHHQHELVNTNNQVHQELHLPISQSISSTSASTSMQSSNQHQNISSQQTSFVSNSTNSLAITNNSSNLVTDIKPTSESFLTEKLQSNEFSKVDIFNQIILSKTSFKDANKLTFLPLSKNVNQPTSNDHNDDYFGRKTNLDPKMKDKKKSEKIFCNVCGEMSSGYHYGSYTCEACKLFFRRTEKQIRKTGFNECLTKNCVIDVSNRASCSECRYKKCVAVGMGMTRSQYGRHTKLSCPTYPSNVSELLCNLIDDLKEKANKSSSQLGVDLSLLNDLIIEFYDSSLKLLTTDNCTPTTSKTKSFRRTKISPASSSSSSSLSELSGILTSNSSARSSYETSSFRRAKRLPQSLLILFCELFDIEINFKLTDNTNRLISIKNEFKRYFQFTMNKILKHNEFKQILKIGIYIKMLRLLLEAKPIKDDVYDKRISDLMRAEFALMKIDTASNNAAKNNNLNLDDSQVNLTLLFTHINQLLYKHLDTYDINEHLGTQILLLA